MMGDKASNTPMGVMGDKASKTPMGAMGVITYTRETTIQHIYSVDVDRFQTPVKHPWERWVTRPVKHPWE